MPPGRSLTTGYGAAWRAAVMAVVLALATAASAGTVDTCRYEYTIWNTNKRAVSDRRTVTKDRALLSDEERGPLGCTPCREDQAAVTLRNGLRFLACAKIAAPLTEALDHAIERGQEVRTVVGYRPQMSRGPADKDGNRTQLSNHSFGVAIDVNEMQNGLYDRCAAWSPACRLIKGGAYRPGEKGSIVAESPLVAALEAIGLRWGGQIAGGQKDFMHFSPTGY
jgi:hypothetical protein